MRVSLNNPSYPAALIGSCIYVIDAGPKQTKMCYLIYKYYRWLDMQETLAVTLLLLAASKRWGLETINRAGMGSLLSFSDLLLALFIV